MSNKNTSAQLFQSSQFGELRTQINEDDQIWFCLIDVCKALELTNSRKVKTQLNPRGVTTSYTPTYNQHGAEVIQRLNFINEPNLYRCVFQSRKKEAEQFQNWVFEEVLPSIRKTGKYQLSQTEERTLHVLQSAKPIHGVKPIIYDGTAGYYMRDIMSALGYSRHSGTADGYKKRYPNDFFQLNGRNYCSVRLAGYISKRAELRAMEAEMMQDLFAEQDESEVVL